MDLKGFVDIAIDVGADTLGESMSVLWTYPPRRQDLWEHTAGVLRDAGAYAADRGALMALTTIHY